MECEICGKREAVCIVNVECAKMNACMICSRGEEVVHFGQDNKQLIYQSKLESEHEIVNDYGKIIKHAREKIGITLEELGLKIAEKANYLERIEKEKTLPSIALARKLEKFFKIKLIETEANTLSNPCADHRKEKLMLSDVVEIEKKK